MSLLKKLERNFLHQPYNWLPIGLFLLLEIRFFGDILAHLPVDLVADPDDYMRLNQTMSWLLGQGWYDLSQPRMSPGANTIIHWARCIDWPIALASLPWIQWLGLREAVLMGSLIAPMLPLALLIIVLPKVARPLMGKRNANLSLLFLLAAPAAISKFGPGRVDHHDWEQLIACIGFMALQFSLLYPRGWLRSLWGGVAFAFGLWIGEEIIPVLGLTVVAMALYSSWRGGRAQRNAAVFGGTLALATAAILPLALPVHDWGTRDVSWFSLAYVLLSTLIGGALILNWWISRSWKNPWLRMAAVSLLGLGALILFLVLVPEAIKGPFANYDDYNGSTALEMIDEALPFMEHLTKDGQHPYGWAEEIEMMAAILMAPVLACLFSVFMITRSRSRMRMIWALFAAFLVVLLGLGLFVQSRVLWFAQIFEFIPLAYLTWNWWERFRDRWSLWGRYLATLWTFLIVGLIPVTVLPFIMDRILLMDETMQVTNGPLSLRKAAEFIRQKYTDRFHTIMAGPNEGPALLFFTPHRVIAGNFNVSGNPDVSAFFKAADDEQAIEVLRKWKADLVLVAAVLPPDMLYEKTDPHLAGEIEKSLINRLVSGHYPAWLNPVEIPGATGYLLFEVTPGVFQNGIQTTP